MNRHVDSFPSDEVVSLYDIYKKIAQYKKVFWSVFFVVFIIGGVKILLTPLEYNFSQMIEVGKCSNEKGHNTINVDLNETIKKIKKVFLPEAVRKYNLHAVQKISMNEKDLMVENVGNGTLILSIHGPLKDLDKCKFILQKIVERFSDDTRKYVDYHKKALNDAKKNLEHLLAQTRDFYKDMTVKYFSGVSEKKKLVSIESQIISMYLNDQNSLMIRLNNDINILQEQIMETYNTRVVSDLIVSDSPIGLPKSLLLILVTMASFFFAFLGVFIFITKVKIH